MVAKHGNYRQEPKDYCNNGDDNDYIGSQESFIIQAYLKKENIINCRLPFLAHWRYGCAADVW